jgi:hypothetical protein
MMAGYVSSLITAFEQERTTTDNKHKNWVDDVARPLADELAKKSDKQSKVLGPHGIGAKLTICLVNDAEDFDWFKDDYMELVIEPDFQNGQLTLSYETGEVSDLYKPATLGYMSGLNNIAAPLPDSIEEILPLFRLQNVSKSSGPACEAGEGSK